VKRYDPGSFNEIQFIREVDALVKLNHPCIARILGYLLPQKVAPAEIHLEYAENGSL
jgi:hypothetical protein